MSKDLTLKQNDPLSPQGGGPSSHPITIRNLTKRFHGRTILDDISFTIEPGQTVALIGPSGGGKSTLLRCLNGLNTFDSGEVHIGPNFLRASTSHRINRTAVWNIRRSLGMIFQDFQLFPHLTVLENVMEAPIRVLGHPRAEAVNKATELLERVGLGHRLEAKPQQLSGGQKQRVAIARALAMKPMGLLCDEITSALDPELKMEVLGVLEQLQREGLTLIMVTHEIGFARRAAHRVLVLAEGKIIEDGTPEQVIDQPKHARTQTFLRCVLG